VSNEVGYFINAMKNVSSSFSYSRHASLYVIFIIRKLRFSALSFFQIISRTASSYIMEISPEKLCHAQPGLIFFQLLSFEAYTLRTGLFWPSHWSVSIVVAVRWAGFKNGCGGVTKFSLSSCHLVTVITKTQNLLLNYKASWFSLVKTVVFYN